MSTAWPWPGVTAWAVANSAVMWSNSSPTSGSQAGSEAFCWVKIRASSRCPRSARTTIAIVSLRRPRACRREPGAEVAASGCSGASARSWVHPRGRGRAGPTWPSAPLRSETGLLVAADFRLQRRHAAELGLGADRRHDRVGVVDLVAERACVALRVRFADQDRAAADVGAGVGAVAVEVLARGRRSWRGCRRTRGRRGRRC